MSCSVFLTCVTGQKCCNIIHLSFTTPTLQHTIAAGDARTLPKSHTNHLDITKTPSTPQTVGPEPAFHFKPNSPPPTPPVQPHASLSLYSTAPNPQSSVSNPSTPRPSPRKPNTTTRCSKKNAVRALSVCVAREKGHSSTLFKESTPPPSLTTPHSHDTTCIREQPLRWNRDSTPAQVHQGAPPSVRFKRYPIGMSLVYNESRRAWGAGLGATHPSQPTQPEPLVQ